MIQTITNAEELEVLIKTASVSVIDFHAPWCGPCKNLAAIMDNLAKKYDGIVGFGTCNVEEYEELADKYGIMHLPTVVFFVNGTEKERVVGPNLQTVYSDKIDNLLTL